MAFVTFNKEDFQCIDFSAVFKTKNINLRSKSLRNGSPQIYKSDLNLDAPVFSPRNKDFDFSAENHTHFSTTISQVSQFNLTPVKACISDASSVMIAPSDSEKCESDNQTVISNIQTRSFLPPQKQFFLNYSNYSHDYNFKTQDFYQFYPNKYFLYVPNTKRRSLARRFEDIDDVSSESEIDENEFFDSYQMFEQ